MADAHPPQPRAALADTSISLWSVEGNVIGQSQGEGKLVRLEAGQVQYVKRSGVLLHSTDRVDWMRGRRHLDVECGRFRVVDEAGVHIDGCDEYRPGEDDEFLVVIADKTILLSQEGCRGEPTSFVLRPGERLCSGHVEARFGLDGVPWGLRRDGQREDIGLPGFSDVKEGDRLWVVLKGKDIVVWGDPRVPLHGICGTHAVVDVPRGASHDDVMTLLKGPLRSGSARMTFKVYTEAGARQIDRGGTATPVSLDFDSVVHQSTYHQRFAPKTVVVHYQSAAMVVEKTVSFQVCPGVDAAQNRKDIGKKLLISDKDEWVLRTQKGGGDRAVILWAHVVDQRHYWVAITDKHIVVYGDPRDESTQDRVERVEIHSSLGARPIEDVAAHFHLEWRQFVLQHRGQKGSVVSREQLEYHQVSKGSEYDLILSPKTILVDDPRDAHEAAGDSAFTIEPGYLGLHDDIARRFGLQPDHFELRASLARKESVKRPYQWQYLRNEHRYYVFRRERTVEVFYFDGLPHEKVHAQSVQQCDSSGALVGCRKCTLKVSDGLRSSEQNRSFIARYFGINWPFQLRQLHPADHPVLERVVWDRVRDGQQLFICKPDKVLRVCGDGRVQGHRLGAADEHFDVRPGDSAQRVWEELSERLRLPELGAEFNLSASADSYLDPAEDLALRTPAGQDYPRSALSYQALADGTRLDLVLPSKQLHVHAVWAQKHSAGRFESHDVGPEDAARSHQRSVERAVTNHLSHNIQRGRFKLCGVYGSKAEAVEAAERSRANADRGKRWSEKEVQPLELSWQRLRAPSGSDSASWVNLYKWKRVVVRRGSAHGPACVVDCTVECSLDSVLQTVCQKWPDWSAAAGGISRVRVLANGERIASLNWFSADERVSYVAVADGDGHGTAPAAAAAARPQRSKRQG
eukprot:TRINITY_DN21294_c0_g1_i1.p1 TRINITY_DN21294_c0_g1~~TRINITY_DN21294_c0_g1_i1.p1  ORF type:complete len:915 (+),score=298.92 TRINITY_DN21294_c0_g1_i1:55-2799(+)